jgi:hypothetical protein
MGTVSVGAILVDARDGLRGAVVYAHAVRNRTSHPEPTFSQMGYGDTGRGFRPIASGALDSARAQCCHDLWRRAGSQGWSVF